MTKSFLMKRLVRFSRLNGPCSPSVARADDTFAADCTAFGASTYESSVSAECRTINLPRNLCRGDKDDFPREMSARVPVMTPSVFTDDVSQRKCRHGRLNVLTWPRRSSRMHLATRHLPRPWRQRRRDIGWLERMWRVAYAQLARDDFDKTGLIRRDYAFSLRKYYFPSQFIRHFRSFRAVVNSACKTNAFLLIRPTDRVTEKLKHKI